MNTQATPVAAAIEPAEAPLMDADFIARHQIVEKYLAGKLPPKGMQDFERFCSRHPELLDTIGLSNQVHAALQLLDAGGKPEPWAHAAPRFYQKPLNFALAAGLAVALLGSTAWFASRASTAEAQLATARRQAAAQPMLPATATRAVLLQPDREAPPGHSQATLNGTGGEFADLKIDVSWSPFTNFRVLIDRVDQGRFAVLGSLTRDSNGQLRLGFNSTGLGPGEYQIALEGLDWRGTPHPAGWLKLSVVR